MPAATTNVADRIQQLLDEREKHSEAVAQIDQKLEQINQLLNGARRRGRPPKAVAAVTQAKPQGRKGRGGRRGRRPGAEDLILGFVQEKGNPTTGEINEFWKSKGRPGKADNTLSKMTREGKLKRKADKNVRGSRYEVA
jgi:hypothetical protein